MKTKREGRRTVSNHLDTLRAKYCKSDGIFCCGWVVFAVDKKFIGTLGRAGGASLHAS